MNCVLTACAVTRRDRKALINRFRPALTQGYLTENAGRRQITEHGKLFLNSLLELFLADE
ncbi:HemN family oxidoreductase [Serratia rubidaea]|uniref:HemN family oxidoreductase n=1 Tax=Serratia rubidaea TaxID=61652 RepID=A0A3S4XFE9_SERRU|nr:HemN family oxidoreductase [Serratia rubidaea]